MKPIYPILLTLLLAACGDGDKKAAGPGAGVGAPPPPEVEVVTVAPSPATLTQELPGRLQAVRTAQVRARVEGVVEKRLFAEGSDVAAGTPLFQLDARTYRAAAASAESDVAVARITLERYKPLLDMKAVSKQEYDLAEAKVKQAEAVLAKANLDLENANVLAPIAGRIGRALVTEGALVGKGEATHLATIEQLNPIYANFTQSNADLLRLQQAVKAGKLKRSGETRVDLVLEDGSLYLQQGRILFADLAVDPNTGSVQMRAEFPNPKNELLPGMFVRIRFPQALAENALRVPQRAVQAGATGQYVMMVGPENKVVPLPVKTGGMSGSDWIIAEGLKGGEQVIVNGLQKARPGSPVTPVPWNATPAAAAQPMAGMAAGMSGGAGAPTGMSAQPSEKK
ncbi:putative efflux pump periplasmic linker TtgA [Rhodocyclaceae bacterium]|nr:putative efflux pump periplasmic linker TtgA [Rhodocyclaceae bacterium]